MLRKVDEIGRVALPAEYRQALHIKENDEIEITLQLNRIVIKKPIFGCVFCDASANLVRIGELCACRSCAERLYNAKDNDTLYPMRID